MEGYNTYEMASDAIWEIARTYFLSPPPDSPLSVDEEAALLAKALQGRGWGMLAGLLKVKKVSEVLDMMRDVVRKLVVLYGEEEITQV